MGDNIDRDKQGSYGALLFDPRWKAKREEISEAEIVFWENNIEILNR